MNNKEKLEELFNGCMLEDGELSEEKLEAVAGGKVNVGFFNGLFDAADDRIFGTTKGAGKSGPLYAVGYSIGYGLNQLGSKIYCGW